MTVSALSTALASSASRAAFDGSPSEKGRGMSAEKRRGIAGFDPQGCVDFLRGRHPNKTARGVEADTGVPARTVERWLCFDATPSLDAFGACLVAYKAPFLAQAMPGLAWVARMAAMAEFDAMTAEVARIQQRQQRLAATILEERT